MINSRKKWCVYELDILHKYKKYYPDVLTSRNWWKYYDDLWIDLLNTPPFNVQCKNVQNFSMSKAFGTLSYMEKNIKWKSSLENNYNIIHTHIKSKWDVVILSQDDFFEILWILKANDII